MQIKNLLKKYWIRRERKLLAGEKRYEINNGIKLSFENGNLEKRSGKMEEN